jgi:hypothetical protein
VVTNYRDPTCVESHNLCLFFERNKLPYRLLDSVNEAKLPHLGKHRVLINGAEITLTQLLDYAQRDVLLSVMRGARCLSCLSKLKEKGVYCPACGSSNNESPQTPCFAKVSKIGLRSESQLFHSEQVKSLKSTESTSKNKKASSTVITIAA